ncbi:MAG: hypothetical protein J7521_20105 [Caulobacter sp.]|nr:hypothetical protein [Caulobacter sp.]
MDAFISGCCKGERCFCGEPAARKVEEVIFDDDPIQHRHPLTRYVCAGHFAQIMGPAGARSVGQEDTVEIVTGDPRFPMVCNETAELIEVAVERLGLDVGVAVCLVAQVAADYARSEYGNAYLVKLAGVVTARGSMPLPEAVPASDGEG